MDINNKCIIGYQEILVNIDIRYFAGSVESFFLFTFAFVFFLLLIFFPVYVVAFLMLLIASFFLLCDFTDCESQR